MRTSSKINCWSVVVVVALAWFVEPGFSAAVASILAFGFIMLQFVIRNLERRLERYELPRRRTPINLGPGFHP